MPTSPLAAVGGTRGEARIALAADLLVAAVKGETKDFVSTSLPKPRRDRMAKNETHLYLEASTLSEGSMIPPRRRRTRCRVDSFWML